VPEGGVEARGALGPTSLILIPPVDLPAACFAFFWGVGVAVALHFSAWVFEAPTLALADGLLADLMLGTVLRQELPELLCSLQTREWGNKVVESLHPDSPGVRS
jgi:hypothetical protein